LLAEIHADLDLSIHCVRLSAASVLRHLNLRIRDLQAARMADAAGRSVGDPLTEAGLPEALGLRREIAANQEAVIATSLYLTLRAQAWSALIEASRALE